MDKLLTQALNEVAFLSNSVIRSPLNLSNVEARLFALALGCLHQKKDTLDFEMHFRDVIPSVGGKSYALLDEAITRLTLPLVSRAKKNGKLSSTRTALFSTIKLDEGTRMIVGRFNSDLKESLLNLSGNFTTVELESLLTLKSANSQRLFWILKSYQHEPRPEPIDFQTLRTWLFGENSEIYPLWYDFNRYLLVPTLAEFKAIGWNVSVQLAKRGKRVDSLLFRMSRTAELEGKATAKTKKTLTLAEVAAFRQQLAAIDQALPGVYAQLQLDYKLKEYQAREVASTITDKASYQLVKKTLYDVQVVLMNANDIKSVAAYTLSQLKAVLPVYQTPAASAPAGESVLQAQLDEARERLAFVENELPTTLFPDEGKAGRVAAIQAEIAALSAQLPA